jgi:general secretion pathway protein N
VAQEIRMSPLRTLLMAALGLLCGGAAFGADTTASTVGAAIAAIDNPLAAESLDQLSTTRQRPLFSPTRRPVPPPPPPVSIPRIVSVSPPPSPPPSVMLFGIVSDASGYLAILRPSTTEKITRVKLGDEISGWRVTEIEPRRLVLSHDSRSTAFTLFNKNIHGPSISSGISQDEPQMRRRRHPSE